MSRVIAPSADEIRELGEIADRYKIPRDHPDRWLQLALCLARNQAEIKPRTGRPTKWTPQVLMELVREIDKFLARGKSALYACNKLQGCEPWKSRIDSTKNRGKRLQEQYQRFIGQSWIEVWISDDPPAHQIVVLPRLRGKCTTNA
jgi:hypothetical protein